MSPYILRLGLISTQLFIATSGRQTASDLPRLDPSAVRDPETRGRLDGRCGREGGVSHQLRQEERLYPGRGPCCGDHGVEAGRRVLQHRQDPSRQLTLARNSVVTL